VVQPAAIAAKVHSRGERDRQNGSQLPSPVAVQEKDRVKTHSLDMRGSIPCESAPTRQTKRTRTASGWTDATVNERACINPTTNATAKDPARPQPGNGGSVVGLVDSPVTDNQRVSQPVQSTPAPSARPAMCPHVMMSVGT